MKFRKEKDTLGSIKIPIDKYWGAQTQRAIMNFDVCTQINPMPIDIIIALAYIKKSSSIANYQLGILDIDKMELISKVCDEIIKGKLNDNFPLGIWQSGSGTQSNMNINEVISCRAHVINGGNIEDTIKILHPNDDVNKSQSSNDVFPSAMNIAAYNILKYKTIPSIEKLKNSFLEKSLQYSSIVKIGRTHFMDATPITLGQEISAYVAQLEYGIDRCNNILSRLLELPIGGTAVGNGINTPKKFDHLSIKILSDITDNNFTISKNKFEALSTCGSIVESHSALKIVAINLMKIANDIRMLSSGPRCGIGEINIPHNEPGSSIMPGKVNPTQCEMVTMVAAQVIGNDTAISFGGSNGHFQLNVFKPMIINNFLHSAGLISDACESFRNKCVSSITPNKINIENNLKKSLMLVTALNKIIGYEKSAKIANYAYNNNLTLKESAMELKYISSDDFDKAINPNYMV
ncbi:MAG: class II fumarate hydratase [Bacteroides sp.]|nr:MAG: class II fumarate hydratase [Bacteroides sp.]